METRGTAGSPLVTSAVVLVLLAIATNASAAAVRSNGPSTLNTAATTETATTETATTETATVETATAKTATAVADVDSAEGRGHYKKMMTSPYMLIPQLIALGFAPIVLANLKMMVMSALMINNMALNAAIFMTVRNMVFGPRPKVKYVNYGYRDGHHHQDGHGPHQQRDDQPPPQQQQQQQQLSEEEAQIAEYRKKRRTFVAGS